MDDSPVNNSPVADNSWGLRSFLKANPAATPEQKQELVKSYLLNYGRQGGGVKAFPGGLVPGAPFVMPEPMRNPGPKGLEDQGTILNGQFKDVSNTIEDIEMTDAPDGVPEISKIKYTTPKGVRMIYDPKTNNLSFNPEVKPEWGKPNPKTGNPRLPLNTQQQQKDRNPFSSPVKYVSELLMGPNEDTVSDQTLPFSSKWTPEENKSFQETGQIPVGRDARDINGTGYQPWVNKSTLNRQEPATIKNNGVIDTVWDSPINPFGLAGKVVNLPADIRHNGTPLISPSVIPSNDWEFLNSQPKPAYATDAQGSGYMTQPESHTLFTPYQRKAGDGFGSTAGKMLGNVGIGLGNTIGGLAEFMASPLGAVTMGSGAMAKGMGTGAVTATEGVAAARAALAAATAPAEVSAARQALATAMRGSQTAIKNAAVSQAMQVPLQGKFAYDLGKGAIESTGMGIDQITGQVPVYNKEGAGYQNRGFADPAAAAFDFTNAAANAAFTGQIGAHAVGAAKAAINPQATAVNGAMQNALTLPPQGVMNKQGSDIADFMAAQGPYAYGQQQTIGNNFTVQPSYKPASQEGTVQPNGNVTPSNQQAAAAYQRGRAILSNRDQRSPASEVLQAPPAPDTTVKPPLPWEPRPRGQGQEPLPQEYQQFADMAGLFAEQPVDKNNLVSGPAGAGRARGVDKNLDPKVAAQAAARAELGLKPGEPLPATPPVTGVPSEAEKVASTRPDLRPREILEETPKARVAISEREYEIANELRLGTDFMQDTTKADILDGGAVIDPRNVSEVEFLAAKSQGLIAPYKKANGVQYWKYTEKGLDMLEQHMEMDGFEVKWKDTEATKPVVEEAGPSGPVKMEVDIIKKLPAIPEYSKLLNQQLADLRASGEMKSKKKEVREEALARALAIREKLAEIESTAPAAEPASVADIVVPDKAPAKPVAAEPAKPLLPEPTETPAVEPVTEAAPLFQIPGPKNEVVPPQPKVNMSGPTARGGPDAPIRRGERGVRTGPWQPDNTAPQTAPQTRQPSPSGQNRVRGPLAKPQFNSRGLPILSAKQMFEKNNGQLHRLTYSHLKDLYDETVADPSHNPKFASRIKDEMDNRSNRFKDSYGPEQEGRNLISGAPVETMTDVQLKEIVDGGQERIRAQREIVAGHNRGDYRKDVRERSQEGRDAIRELSRLEYQWKFAKQEQNKRVRVNAGIARPDGSRIVASKERQLTQMRVDPVTGEQMAVPPEKRKPVEALNHSRGRFDKLSLDELVAAEAELRKQGRGYADKVAEAIQARLKEGNAVHRRLHGKDADNIPNPRTATRDQLEARIPELKSEIAQVEAEIAGQRKSGNVDPAAQKRLSEAKGDLSAFERELSHRDGLERADIRYDANKGNFKQVSGDIQGTGTAPKGNGYTPPAERPAPPAKPEPIVGREKPVIQAEGAAAFEAEQRAEAAIPKVKPDLGLEGQGRNASPLSKSGREWPAKEAVKHIDDLLDGVDGIASGDRTRIHEVKAGLEELSMGIESGELKIDPRFKRELVNHIENLLDGVDGIASGDRTRIHEVKAGLEEIQMELEKGSKDNPLGLEGQGRNAAPRTPERNALLKRTDAEMEASYDKWYRALKELENAVKERDIAGDAYKKAERKFKKSKSEADEQDLAQKDTAMESAYEKWYQKKVELDNAVKERDNAVKVYKDTRSNRPNKDLGLEGQGRNSARQTIDMEGEGNSRRDQNKAERQRFIANEAVYMKLSDSQRRLADTIARGGSTVRDVLKQIVAEAKADKTQTSSMTKMAELLLKNSDQKSLDHLVEMNKDRFLQESFYHTSGISGLNEKGPRTMYGKVSMSQLHLSDPKDLMRVVMHEFVHATTSEKVNRAIFGNAALGNFNKDIFGQSGQKYVDRLRAYARDPNSDKSIAKVAQAYLKYLSTLESKGDIDTRPITRESLDSNKNRETGENWRSNLVGNGIDTRQQSTFGQYRVTNLHEFMSAAMTEKDFQAELRGIKMGNTDMLSKFRDAIAEVLGITPSDSVLRHTFDGVMEISAKDLSEIKKPGASYMSNLADVRAERNMSEGMSGTEARDRAVSEIDPRREDAFGFGKQAEKELRTPADIRADMDAIRAEDRENAVNSDIDSHWKRRDKFDELSAELREVESDMQQNTLNHPRYEEALRNVEDNNLGNKRDTQDTNDAVAAEIDRLEGIDSGNYDAKRTPADRKRFYERSKRSESSLGEELRTAREKYQEEAGLNNRDKNAADFESMPPEFKAKVDFDAYTSMDSFAEQLANSDNPDKLLADTRRMIADEHGVDPSVLLENGGKPLLSDKKAEPKVKDNWDPLTDEDLDSGFEQQDYGSKKVDNTYPNDNPRDPSRRRRFTDNKTDASEALGDFNELERYHGVKGPMRQRGIAARQVAEGVPDYAGIEAAKKAKEERTAREKERMDGMARGNSLGLEGQGRDSSKLGDFASKEARASSNRVLEVTEAIKKFTPDTKLDAAHQAKDILTVSMLTSGQAHLDKLASYEPNPVARRAITTVNDLLMGGRAGDMTRAVKNGYHSKIKTENNILNSRKNNALKPLESRLESLDLDGQRALLEDIGRAVVSKTVNADPQIAAAATAFRDLYRDMYYMQKNAGIDFGSAGPNYLPRMLNNEVVLKDRQGFVNAAAKAYETTGLDPVDAMDAANAWWYNIQRGYEGFAHNGKDFIFDAAANSGEPSHTRHRVFGDTGEAFMEKYYNRNIIDATEQYIGRAVKASQLAERFGPKFEKYQALQQDIIDFGRKGDRLVGEVNTTLKNQLSPQVIDSSVLRGANDAIALYQSIRFLPRAVISSLGEPFVGGMRTGRMTDSIGTMFDSISESIAQVRRSDPSYSAKLAADIGVIQNILSDSALSSSVDNRMTDVAVGGLAKKIQNMYFRTTGLHQWTEGTRIASVKLGETFVRRLCEDINDGGRSRELSARYLVELGIDSADHAGFVKYIKSLEKLNPQQRLDAISGKQGSKYAAPYADALVRFSEQVIMDPNRGNRARWANHPLGNIIMGLQSYLYAFNENVVKRTVKTTGAALFNSDKNNMSGYNRTMLLGPLMASIPFMAFQYGQGYARDKLLSDPSRSDDEPLSDGNKIARAISRSAVLGRYDFLFNVFGGFKYDKDPATIAAGPVVGSASTYLKDKIGLYKDSNSPNTNTAERRSARGDYDSILAPAAGFTGALLPGVVGRGVGTALTYAANHPATREAYVEKVAGPPVAKKPLTDNQKENKKNLVDLLLEQGK